MSNSRQIRLLASIVILPKRQRNIGYDRHEVTQQTVNIGFRFIVTIQLVRVHKLGHALEKTRSESLKACEEEEEASRYRLADVGEESLSVAQST